MNVSINQTGKKIQNYVYNYSDFLGAGNFSKCYKGYNQITKEVVAIKIVQLNSLKSKKLQQLLFQEIQILKKLNHPSVLKSYQIFTSNRNCYIITQLCNEGNLQNKLKIKRVFEQNQANPIIRDVYDGLIYLAQNYIVHRDLKSANIFLHNGRAKIADFGFAKQINHNFKDLNIGSPLYMAPQGILHNVYGPKTQVWALGILVYELFHGSSPYSNCKTQDQLRKNVVIPLRMNQLRPDLSQDIKQFILTCLEVNEQKRASIEQINNLPYIQRLKRKTQSLNEYKFDFQSPSRSVHLSNNKSFQANRNNFQRTNNNFRPENNMRSRQLSKNNNQRPAIYKSVNARSHQLINNDKNFYQSPSRINNGQQINKFFMNSLNRSYNMINQNTGYIQNPIIVSHNTNLNHTLSPMVQAGYQNNNFQQNMVQYHNVMNPNMMIHNFQQQRQNILHNFQNVEKGFINQDQNLLKSKNYNYSRQIFNNQVNESFQQNRRPKTSYQSQTLGSPIYDSLLTNSNKQISFIQSNNQYINNNQIPNFNDVHQDGPHKPMNNNQMQTSDKEIPHNINRSINVNNMDNKLKPFQQTNPNKTNLQKIKVKNLFTQQLTFKQAIFFIHYCRLIFKFLCIYKESKYFQSQTFITMYKHIISILTSLKQLCQQKKVLAQGQKANIKVKKFKQVTLQYLAKYKKQLQQNEYYFQPELIQQKNMIQMKQRLKQMQIKFYKETNQLLGKNNLSANEENLIVLAHLEIIIFTSLQQIWKAFDSQNCKNLTQIKHIQNVLNTPKEEFTITSYLNYRNKFNI